MFVIVGIAALAMLGIMGSTIYSTVVSGNQRSTLSTNTSQILTQAAAAINSEVNAAGSYPVAAAILVAAPNPVGGGQIYAASAAPKVDAWGAALGYCVNTAAAQGDPVFAVLSAGPDKTFQTTCAQALVGTAAGDDGVRAKNAASIKQGVGGTLYFGDPVTAVADLATLVPRAGEMRVVKSTGLTYVNATGVAGAANWVLSQNTPTVVSAADCTGYPLGTMGKDTLGNIYTCQ